MAQSKKYDLSGPDGPIVFRELPVGVKVRTSSGAIGKITGNPGDGAFIMVEILEDPDDPSRVGTSENVFFLDVKGVVDG